MGEPDSWWRTRIREERHFLHTLFSSWWTYLFLAAAILALLVALVLRPAPKIQVGVPRFETLLQGFHAPEQAGARSFRWSEGQATILVPDPGLPSQLTLVLRAAGQPQQTKPLTISVGGVPLAEIPIRPEPATYAVALDLPPGAGSGTIAISLSCATFRPANDPRDLGIQLEEVMLLPRGQNLAALLTGTSGLLLALVLVIYVVFLRLTLRPWVAVILSAPALAIVAAGVQRAWLILPPYLFYGKWVIAVLALFLFSFAPEVQRDGRGAFRALLRGRPRALAGRAIRVTRPRVLFWIVQLLALVVLALHLLAPYLPKEYSRYDSYAWGVRFFSRLPLAWQVAALALAAAACLASPFLARLWIGLARKWPRPRHLNRYLGIAGVSVVAVAPLWLLRTRCYSGDWEWLLKLMVAGKHLKESSLLDFYLRAAGGQFLAAHWPAWLASPEPMTRCLDNPALATNTYGSLVPAQAAISCLTGSIFVAAILLLGRYLFDLRPERWLFVLLCIGQGSLMLFSGYIEVYTLMTAATAVYLLLAVLALQRRIDLIWPAVVLVVAVALHMEALYLLPSFGMLLILRFGEEKRKWPGWVAGLFKAAWAGLLVAIVLVLVFLMAGLDLQKVGADIRGGGVGGVDYMLFKHLLYVPPGAQETYPILSLPQLRAVLNELLLVSPLALPVGTVVLVFLGPAGFRKDRVLQFLLVTALVALLLIVVWNPDLGPREDWDLLAPPVVPLTVAAAYLVLAKVGPARIRLAVGITWLAVSLLHAGSWLLMSHWGL